MFPTDSKAEIVIPELTESNLNDEADQREGPLAIAPHQLRDAITMIFVP